jgi:hypothetical protein
MEGKSITEYEGNEHELQHHTQYYDKNSNYQSLIVNDDKNPSLLITKEEIIGKYFLHHHPVLRSFYCANLSQSEGMISHSINQHSTESSSATASLSSSLPSSSVDTVVPSSMSYYYLLNGKRDEKDNYIPFHRLLSADQTFHFYFGKPIVLIELGHFESGHYHEIILGNNIMKHEVVSYTVKAGTWFGGYLLNNEGSISGDDRHGKATSLLKQGDSSNVLDNSVLNALVSSESFCYSFFGGTISPGTDHISEENIEVGSYDRLLNEYPNAKQFIQMLTNREL